MSLIGELTFILGLQIKQTPKGNALISWYRKKQTSVALSTTKAEYIAVESCGTQILWIMHQLLDFDLSFEFVPIMCDNTSVINLSK